MKRTHRNQNKYNKIYKFWLIGSVSRVLTGLHRAFKIKDSNESQGIEVFSPLLRQLDRVATTRGPSGLIAYVKAIREQLLHYLSDNGVVAPGIGVTKDGLPTALGDLIPLIRREDSPVLVLPFLTTILGCTRALNSGRIPDISPISCPPKGGSERVIVELGRYVRDFGKALGMLPSLRRLPRRLAFKQFHFSSKAGPNGQALASSLHDLYSLPLSLVESICYCGGEKLKKTIKVLLDPNVQPYIRSGFSVPSQLGKIRKLSYFPDKEQKVRVIGILDYGSQCALKPLHHYLYKVLRKIPQDCTFDQGSFRAKCVKGTEFVSVDLKSATDRFPITLIAHVLKGHLPSQYIDSGVDIMSGYPFDITIGKRHESVSYSVGNPMGAYSSGASFAVANHYVIYYCCRKLGMDWKTAPYVLLGDDILIGNFKLAEMYIQTIESLGVEVSVLKTHWSKHFGEFAKRLIFKGQEISPFPMSAIKEVGRKYYLLTNFIMEQGNREGLVREGVPEAVELFYEYVKPVRRKLRRDLRLRAEVSEAITKVMRGVSPASDVVNLIARRSYPHFSGFTELESKEILVSLVREMFGESDPTTSSSKGRSLGAIALRSIIQMTSVDEFYSVLSPAGFEVSFIPLLQVYGQVEEKGLKSQKQGIELEKLGTDGPLTLRSMLIIASDEVFVMKSRDLRAQSSAAIGRKLEGIVKLRLANLRDEEKSPPDCVLS